MTGERLFVRCTMTALCVVLFVVFMPIMLTLKLAEGVYLGFKIAHESIEAIWAARGDPGLDKKK